MKTNNSKLGGNKNIQPNTLDQRKTGSGRERGGASIAGGGRE